MSTQLVWGTCGILVGVFLVFFVGVVLRPRSRCAYDDVEARIAGHDAAQKLQEERKIARSKAESMVARLWDSSLEGDEKTSLVDRITEIELIKLRRRGAHDK
jgi:hypothetical protein